MHRIEGASGVFVTSGGKIKLTVEINDGARHQLETLLNQQTYLRDLHS